MYNATEEIEKTILDEKWAERKKWKHGEVKLPRIELTIREVKTCPFCGGQSDCATHYLYGKVKGYFVYCKKCGIEQGKIYKSKQGAIKAWKRRVDDGRED